MTDGGRLEDINVAARHAIAFLTANSRTSSTHVGHHRGCLPLRLPTFQWSLRAPVQPSSRSHRNPKSGPPSEQARLYLCAHDPPLKIWLHTERKRANAPRTANFPAASPPTLRAEGVSVSGQVKAPATCLEPHRSASPTIRSRPRPRLSVRARDSSYRQHRA